MKATRKQRQDSHIEPMNEETIPVEEETIPMEEETTPVTLSDGTKINPEIASGAVIEVKQ